MAARGERGYVRIDGRISSDEEFPDEFDNPIVYRRRRLQRRTGRGGWQTFDDQRLAVPFGLEARGDHIALDADALGEGLVVVPRLSMGIASELGPDDTSLELPTMAPDTPVRLRIDQVSATDHATAAGVPGLAPTGRPMLTAGLDRPLILTTLEPAAAMRVLASEQRRSVLLATALLALAVILGAGAAVAVVLGA